MTRPLCSVLIPCGPNHVHLLDRAVESAKAQTVPVEVLTFIDHERRGPGYGRNRLAEQATGLFLCYLDSDDHLYPHAIETLLKHWRPGSYTYSDWHEIDEDGVPHHVEATSCYIDWRYNKREQRAYHLTPVLFPTNLHHELGGYNEAMYSAEDSDFFYKANVRGIVSIRVHEPLFVYSNDGQHARSTSGREHPSWFGVLRQLIQDYQKEANVGCCGDVNPPGDIMNVQGKQEGDILVRTKWKGNRKVVGKRTGRKYGRLGNGKQVWMDPRDAAAEPRFFEATIDAVALSPTADEIRTALESGAPLTSTEALAQRIYQAGVRNWHTMERPGFDMQQEPRELAQFIAFCIVEGVKTVLEIGTGESGGLARFLATLGMQVTSIDPRQPETYTEDVQYPDGGSWTFIQADSRDVDAVGLPEDAEFDLVFIDGNHEYDYVKADDENYGKLGRVVGFHDIAHDGWHKGVARYWKEIAYTEKGNLRKRYHEAITPDAKTGIGWYVRN